MALIRDPDGITHIVDIFYGGTLCGRDWNNDWDPVDGYDPTCSDCNLPELLEDLNGQG